MGKDFSARLATGLQVFLKKFPWEAEHNDIGIVYKHVLFAFLYETYLEQLHRLVLGGGVETTPRFWENMVGHTSYTSHPMHRHPLFYREVAVALGMRGEGTVSKHVGRSWAKVVDCVPWRSCLLKENVPSIGSLIVTFIFQMQRLVRNGVKESEERVWREIVWSLHCLFEGVWPDRNADNNLYNTSQWMRFSFIPMIVLVGMVNILCGR